MAGHAPHWTRIEKRCLDGRERERIIIETATKRKRKGRKYEYATGRRSDDGDDDAGNEAKPTQTAGPSLELFLSHSELLSFFHAFL